MREESIDGPVGALAVADFGGAGPDLLLVHGANRTLLDWLPMLERLRDVHCVAYDLRGHGHSTPPADDDYGFDAHLADLDAVLSATGLRHPVIVGHSLGADIAIEYAGRNRSCRAIVDIDGFGGGHPRQYPDYDAADVQARRRAQTEAVIAMLGDERVSAEKAQTIVDNARAAAARIGTTPELEEQAAGARSFPTAAQASCGAPARRPSGRSRPRWRTGTLLSCSTRWLCRRSRYTAPGVPTS